MRTYHGHCVVIDRVKLIPATGCSLCWNGAKWSAKLKAEVSWSKGSGVTQESAQEIARAIRWAAEIAKNLNTRNPDKLTNQDITSVNY